MRGDGLFGVQFQGSESEKRRGVKELRWKAALGEELPRWPLALYDKLKKTKTADLGDTSSRMLGVPDQTTWWKCLRTVGGRRRDGLHLIGYMDFLFFSLIGQISHI